MKYAKPILIAALVVSFATVGYFVVRGHHAHSKQGFTLHITQTAYPAGREPILSATKVRQQKADGSWMVETTYADGRKTWSFSEPRGAYEVDERNHKLVYLSSTGETQPSEDQLRTDPSFKGEGIILGYKTLLLTSADESGGYTELYLCPALQNYPLKSVLVSKNGSRTVFEATAVVLGEPSFAMPNYPVDMERYNKIHPQ